MGKMLNRLLGDKTGATAIEYGLIIALIVLALVGGLTGFANKTTSMWNNLSTEVLAH